MKRTIRLTESDLHRVIKESVRRILKEYIDYSETNQAWDELTGLSYPEQRMKNNEMFWPDENLNIYDSPYSNKRSPGYAAMQALKPGKEGDSARKMGSTVRDMANNGLNVGSDYKHVMNGDKRRTGN